MSANGLPLGKCLVVGACGMLGHALVRQLLAAGESVRLFDLGVWDGPPGAQALQGDLRDAAAVDRAVEGMDTVFQLASAVWNPKLPRHLFEEINVDGHRHVIEACLKHGVKRLVYTSSMDVVLRGRTPIVDGDETLPYRPDANDEPYVRTKIAAEKMTLAANGKGALSTCAIRPVGMYGPRDRYHLPALIGLAKSPFAVRMGDGRARFSHVFCENASWAHLLAARQLGPGSPVAGQAYFVCDDGPAENFFTFLEPFLARLGLRLPKRSIPYAIAYPLAALVERLSPTSVFNRFSVIQTCVDMTFVHRKATRDFGYRPPVGRKEALERTVAWLLKEAKTVPAPESDATATVDSTT
ncbi:MAG: NAD-dependent epimerase/dehydratase family protein [Spirochaetes bacterium]|nr:NAD-dependent epimerase/dehydratase family protein [Spirochaetota bacterium]